MAICWPLSLALHEVEILNDFAAIAWATLRLTEADFVQIGGRQAGSRLPIVPYWGPAQGSASARWCPVPRGWTAVAGEGGHVTLPASTPEEAKLIQDCFAEYGHCSAERLLCGAGLARIHAATWRVQALAPEEVTRRAVAGDRRRAVPSMRSAACLARSRPMWRLLSVPAVEFSRRWNIAGDS